MSDIKANYTKREQTINSALAESKKRLVDTETRLQAANDLIVELKQHVLRNNAQHEEKIRLTSEEFIERESMWTIEKNKLGAQVTELSQLVADMKHNQDSYKIEVGKLKATIKSLTEMNEVLLQEKETLLADKEGTNEELLAGMTKNQDLTRRFSTLKKEKSNWESTEKDLRQKIAALEETLQMCRLDAEKNKDIFDRETQAYKHNVEMSREVNEVMRSLEDAGSDLKKENEAYAAKVSDMKRNQERLREENIKLQSELRLRASQEESRAQDMQRRQDAFIALLKEEAGPTSGRQLGNAR
ncbi:hypothetical protein HK405_004101 [Cladochytrium tenue]|nr:hypothetical protein HK405_004101 [Cladochytrium tenue]